MSLAWHTPAFVPSEPLRGPVLAYASSFASLYQISQHDGRRTAAEEASFQLGWRVMANLYASPRTLVLQHKAMGGVRCTFPQDPSGLPDYDHSGWCVFEQACAGLASWKLLELGVGRVLPCRACVSRRSLPDAQRLFSDPTAVSFSQPLDRDRVSTMYAALVDRMIALDDYDRTVREMNTQDRGTREGRILTSFAEVRKAARERKQRYDRLLNEV